MEMIPPSGCAAGGRGDPPLPFLFAHVDKISAWRRLESKDREKVIDFIDSHENWRNCFSEVALA